MFMQLVIGILVEEMNIVNIIILTVGKVKNIREKKFV